MTAYIVSRILQIIPTILILTVVVFVILRAIPGDATISLMAESGRYDAEQLAAIREEWHLDDNIISQYLTWLGNNLRGEFGYSFYTERSVETEMLARAPATVELATIAVALGALIGLPLGIISAAWRNSPLDVGLRTFSLSGLAIPEFWVGTLILVLPAVWWRWSPPLTYEPLFDNPTANLTMILPAAAALSLGTSAVLLRLVRSAMLETLNQDYIRTARAKGLGGATILTRHALRNALVPVVTVLGIQFAALVGGTVVIEAIFNIPGLGQQTLRALEFRDYPQLQFNILVVGVAVLVLNLLVDLSYGVLDPRMRVA